MATWRTRLELARDGWHTTLRLDAPRGAMPSALGFWARSYHWAGRLSDVCFHAHVPIAQDATPQDLAAAVDALIDPVARTCLTARAEWPDRVPCALHGAARPDGRLVLAEHTGETAYIAARTATVFPTEAIDTATGSWNDPAHALANAMYAAWMDGQTTEHSLRVHHRPGRSPHDVADRPWMVEATVVVHDHAGTAVAYRPIKARTEVLEGPAIAALLTGLHASARGLFEAYGPGGPASGRTPNGLPPGFQTVAAHKEAMEQAIALLDPDDAMEG